MMLMLPELSIELIFSAEDIAAQIEIKPAGWSQRQGTGRAVEQRNLELTL